MSETNTQDTDMLSEMSEVRTESTEVMSKEKYDCEEEEQEIIEEEEDLSKNINLHNAFRVLSNCNNSVENSLIWLNEYIDMKKCQECYKCDGYDGCEICKPILKIIKLSLHKF